MKKLLYFLSFLAMITMGVRAQQVVFDPAVVSTLIVNHTAQQEVLKEVRDSEGQIAAAQKLITFKMAEIKDLNDKMYSSLKSVQTVMGQSKNIVYCTQIAADIGKYQGQMIDIAKGDPELMLIAAKTELALINRTADLFNYIYQVAVVGTDMNLMSNADRLTLIRHVVDELRIMRGLSYSICRKMKTAKYAGLWKAMNPLGVAYPNNSQAIIQDLLNEHKKLKKK